MNKEAATLLCVLSKCGSDDAELEHEGMLQQIIHSDAYLELEHRQAFSKEFSRHFTEDKLRGHSTEQLARLGEAISYIPRWLENVIFSLKNGAAPKLTPDDAPDYFDPEGLKKRADMLEMQTGENYTNITPKDFMTIFDSTTIKSSEDIFDHLEVSDQDYGGALKKALKGTKYCVSKSEIVALEKEYEEKISQMEGALVQAAKEKRRRRTMKICLGITFLFIPSLFNSITGLISQAELSGCLLIQMILVLIYWVLG